MYSASLFNSLGGVFHRFSWFEFFHLFSLFWKLLTYTWTYVPLCILLTYIKILSLVIASWNLVPQDIENFSIFLALHDITLGFEFEFHLPLPPLLHPHQDLEKFSIFFLAIHDLTWDLKYFWPIGWDLETFLFQFNLSLEFQGQISLLQWEVQEKGLSAWNTIAFTIITLLNYYRQSFEFELA